MSYKELEDEYRKLSGMERQEFLMGQDGCDLAKVESPVVAELLKKFWAWEKFIQKGDKTMDETKKGTGKDISGQEGKVTEQNGGRALAVKDVPREMSIKETMELGDILAKSRRFIDIQNSQQAVVQILAGRELGFGPITSMTLISIIKGKVSLLSQLMGACIKKSGEWDYKVKIPHTNERCELEFYKAGVFWGNSVFTMEDARRAQLVRPGSDWIKYPRNMLFARALSNGARWYCPHLIAGAYTPEELGAKVNEQGEVVRGEVIETTGETPMQDKLSEPKPEPKPKSKSEPTRDEQIADLKAKYSEDKMKAVKKELEIKGKLAEIDDKVWIKFIKALKK